MSSYIICKHSLSLKQQSCLLNKKKGWLSYSDMSNTIIHARKIFPTNIWSSGNFHDVTVVLAHYADQLVSVHWRHWPSLCLCDIGPFVFTAVPWLNNAGPLLWLFFFFFKGFDRLGPPGIFYFLSVLLWSGTGAQSKQWGDAGGCH